MGVLANTLPRRIHREWDGTLPISATVIPSALVQFFVGFGVGIPGFLAYAQRAASVANDMMMAAADRELAGQLPAGSVTTAGPVSMSFFSIFAFAFFTPLGLLATYLVVSGLARFLSAVAEEPHGDPVLTLADHGWRRLRARVRRDRAVAARERLEGPAVPDVCVRGPDAGEPEALFVIIASRQKPGWDKGVFVVTSETWYRIEESYDRTFPGGLRRVYPLSEVAKAEVLRRSVYYELPRVSEATQEPGSPAEPEGQGTG